MKQLTHTCHDCGAEARVVDGDLPLGWVWHDRGDYSDGTATYALGDVPHCAQCVHDEEESVA